MCYTGKCWFESGGGDTIGCCSVSSFEKFKETYGLSACTVGGVCESEKDERFLEEHAEEIEQIRSAWLAERIGKIRATTSKAGEM